MDHPGTVDATVVAKLRPVHLLKPRLIKYVLLLASLGGSVGCTLTGDLEVAVSTPTGLATVFCRNWIMEYFLWSFSPFH